MKSIASRLRGISANALESGRSYWAGRIKEDFGMDANGEDPIVLRQTHQILSCMAPRLVKACGVNALQFRDDMGPNKPYYPNHGYYVDGAHFIALNSDIFHHPDVPDDFMDHRGYFMSRPQQTLLHELGHAFDDNQGMVSLEDGWLKLSGWSKDPKPGLKKLFIKEDGTPPVMGEWFFDPEAGFTRFYAKRNPQDDFADSFSFYVAGMKSKMPDSKKDYLDRTLGRYC